MRAAIFTEVDQPLVIEDVTLAEPGPSVLEVSMAVGFDNASSFARAFARSLDPVYSRRDSLAPHYDEPAWRLRYRALGNKNDDCAALAKALADSAWAVRLRAADLVITLEDHVLMGGYGSTVLEHFADARIATPVVRIGWPDVFVEHASTVDHLRNKYGLTVENTVTQAKAKLAASAAAQVNFKAA